MTSERPSLRIPPPSFLRDTALQTVLAALPSARLVGGAVRDTIAELPVADIDLATPETPERVMEALERAGLKHAPTGLQHGTVTAISGGRGFEVTTLRTDERTDGRHAEVAWTTEWRADAARRDFTINAMSMRPDGAVFDYFGGIEDLLDGRVRFVGDPARRIAEDYLRVLRFFRFAARYGRAAPDAGTEQALRDAVPALGRLSAERVWNELKRILAVPDAMPAIETMARLGVLDAVLPGGVDVPGLARLVAAGAPSDPLLRLTALCPGAARLAPVLKLSAAEAERLAALSGPAPAPDVDDAALRRALADVAPDVLAGRSWLLQGPAGAMLRARLAGAERPVFPLAGRDLVELGLPPGPAVGEWLRRARAWWLAGGCVADAAACRAQVAAWLGR